MIQDFIDNIFDYGDTVTWLHGKHIIKGGAQILRYQENYYYGGNDGTMGEFVYNGIFTRDLTVNPTAGLRLCRLRPRPIRNPGSGWYGRT